MSITRRILQSMRAKELDRLVPGSLRDLIAPRLSQYLAHQDLRASVEGRTANIQSIIDRLKASYHPISCPLVLISQVQRSGGSLLAQLFDGHGEILAHPQELKIGHPVKEFWPPIDSRFSVDRQFEILFEMTTIEMCRSGYTKDKKDDLARKFFLVPQIQRELFRHIAVQAGRATPRDVLNAYFTSYFNAWLNYRSHIARAKYVAGFVPMLVNEQANMDHFWSAYPDGYLISVIRSPLSWYPSAARLARSEFPNLEISAGQWLKSAKAIFREKQRRGARVIVLKFDDLVTKTESVMRIICSRLGIAFDPILVSPTFNGEPTGANTSFERMERGTVSAAPTRRDKHLSEQDRTYLETHCMPLYERALDEIVEAVPTPKRRAERRADQAHSM